MFFFFILKASIELKKDSRFYILLTMSCICETNYPIKSLRKQNIGGVMTHNGIPHFVPNIK